MPRIFKEADKTAIREKLVNEGKRLFQRYGIRKTSVEELATSVGIAKGTFYHFFESKEDLCLAIFDREEEKLAKDMSAALARSSDPVKTIENLIAFSLEFVRQDSLLARLRESGEYELLVRGVSPDRLSTHLSHDVGTARNIIAALRGKGARVSMPADVLAGVLRSVVVLALQGKMIGEDVYKPVMSLFSSWVAEGIVKGGKQR
jgi:AcrR family transcriptional regulator